LSCSVNGLSLSLAPLASSLAEGAIELSFIVMNHFILIARAKRCGNPFFLRLVREAEPYRGLVRNDRDFYSS